MADAKIINDSNQKATFGMKHVRRLIENKRCRKHPSSPNKIRVTAIKGGEPKAELVVHCCPEFLKVFKTV